MKKALIIGLALINLTSIASFAQTANSTVVAEPVVLINTEYGEIKVKLYNETPKHRDNFLKLVKDTFYNGTLFHRIIQGFMIQGGDPTSRNADPNAMLGEGDVGYTIPAEIVSKYFHKKGALAAARQGDDVNPEKASSGCQFYIVHGRAFTEQDLVGMEARINMQTKQMLFKELIDMPENEGLKNRFIANQKTNNTDSLNLLSKAIEPLIELQYKKLTPYKFTDEQKKVYTTIGGAPHLDSNYTVFGEVIEGLDVVDKIAAVEKNQFDRPLKDVKMTMRVVQ